MSELTYKQKYYLKNKEKIRAQQAAWYQMKRNEQNVKNSDIC